MWQIAVSLLDGFTTRLCSSYLTIKAQPYNKWWERGHDVLYYNVVIRKYCILILNLNIYLGWTGRKARACQQEPCHNEGRETSPSSSWIPPANSPPLRHGPSWGLAVSATTALCIQSGLSSAQTHPDLPDAAPLRTSLTCTVSLRSLPWAGLLLNLSNPPNNIMLTILLDCLIIILLAN